ncbi:zinc-dependent dehydrogenase [Candidatus Nitrosotalea okcheonensis]|nr:zinc-dependent dehydrogenase [Candidatus Nitrosotalea okcheonensis]MDE1728478.1 zinc-dependent dehydrogenase [Nitrososphaerota archaeon]MDE1832178.1 zinc-dependent dehydrogenase [Nitrososphaerota archaeon]
MKVAYVSGSSDVQIKNVERPHVSKGEILVSMKACGVCGSDLEKIYGKYSQPSMRLGHEPSGIVSAIGDGVTNFKNGDRVFAHHHVPCHSCHYCTHGNETMCQKYSETNLLPCGLAEEFIVPEWNVSHGGVIKLPDHVSFESASMIEPLACCVRAWNKIKFKKGDSIAILGAGPTGLMHLMLSKAYGIQDIFCLDINDFRLEFAKKFGITESIRSDDPEAHQKILSKTHNRGVDIAMVSTGNINAISQAIDFVRKGGTVVLFGVPTKDVKMSLEMSKVYSKEITITPSYAASENDTNEAFRLISQGTINVQKLITHKFDLADSAKALDYAHQVNDSMKIIITNSETLN